MVQVHPDLKGTVAQVVERLAKNILATFVSTIFLGSECSKDYMHFTPVT